MFTCPTVTQCLMPASNGSVEGYIQIAHTRCQEGCGHLEGGWIYRPKALAFHLPLAICFLTSDHGDPTFRPCSY